MQSVCVRLGARLSGVAASASCCAPVAARLVLHGARAAVAVCAPSASASTASVRPIDESLLGKFRLRKTGKWSDVAPYISEINFAFDPALSGTTGCKELWRQSRGNSIRAQYPKYTVGLDVNENGLPATLKVKYADGKAIAIDAQGKGVPELIDALLAPTEVMREKEDAVEMDKN